MVMYILARMYAFLYVCMYVDNLNYLLELIYQKNLFFQNRLLPEILKA